MTDEEKLIQQWFLAKGFRAQLQIGQLDVSPDPSRHDYRPDHDEKYVRVDRIREGQEPELVRRYKMDPKHNSVAALKEAQKLFAADLESGDITIS